jgi:predicted RNA-binding Zn ribbon-like protein
LHFAPDTAAVLDFAVALVNTAPDASKSGEDEIATPEQLTALLDLNRYSGRFDRDRRELAEVVEARAELRRIWSLDRDTMVGELNALLAEVNAVPRLERHDGFDWHLHATPPEAPLADRIRVEVALALVDVVRADEVGRLRVCAATDCEGLLADLSRNGSKRFCSVRCGNRMNMVAFRDRQA